MNRNRKTAFLLVMPLILAVFFAFMLPYGAAFFKAFSGGKEVSVWENTALLHITLFTLKQAFFSVLLSLAIGLPGAWFIANSRSRITAFLKTITAIPFAMPSILVVLGFVLFFGNSGWVNRLLTAIRVGDDGPLRILYRPEAIILAHGFFNFPLVIRLVGDGLSRARRAYAPAAACLGASPFFTALTVLLPLALPALMSAVLLVFLYSFTSFAVVLVLGGGPASTTLSVEIYRHARIFLNYQNAAVLALLETLIAVTIFLTYVFFSKRSREIKTDIEERLIDEKTNPLTSTITLFIKILLYGVPVLVFILGPLISIILESILYRPSRAAGQVMSLRWWTSLSETCLPALLRSLVLAFSSATGACLLAILGSGSLKLIEDRSIGDRHTGTSFTTNLIRFFGAAPIVSSGIVLGLGWLIVYGRNFSRFPFALVILHAVIALPFAFNFISEGFRSLPVNILNASAISGAGPLLGLCTIALPLSLRRIRSAWGFAAALSLGELNAVMMLGIEDWETLPLYIYRAVGAYRYGTACAAGTLLIIACVGCFILSDITGGKNET